jgi:hypothetical protein
MRIAAWARSAKKKMLTPGKIKLTLPDAQRGVGTFGKTYFTVTPRRYAVYLFYWYKCTNTDAYITARAAFNWLGTAAPRQQVLSGKKKIT